MTKIVKQGQNRAYAAGKSAKHAQRTPLPPKGGPQKSVEQYHAEVIALREELAALRRR